MRTRAKNVGKTVRRNFLFSERMIDRISDLMNKTDATSETDVIKKSLLTYAALVAWLEKGAVFFIKDSDDRLVQLDLLIDVSQINDDLLYEEKKETISRKELDDESNVVECVAKAQVVSG